ncbi:restriction endonuclease [Aeromonas hydrophila]|uniref:restriction endonuclease n=1 Tax=Aeromonas hydrophila TaxID=644 RepID=UPI00214E4D96|nr:restriction endonuclease [Aeromonas hydrophila]MCR3952689.1 restriction endonuclease [Aeromonas hydrophila]MCW4617501.1 restriction endonuclease [Aeromonas hydrophila]
MTDTSTKLTDIDFFQEKLDFSEITPTDFENLVFHLLDEMGFSNLIWRKGGEGNSATDGGRDLEGTFWTVLPAISKEEKYWFEVKYRTNQLEKIQVQSTVMNASGNNSKDNLIIITNKTISNPTLDWIKEFQNANKLPSVTIWQGHDLELLLRKNPRTLARFLPSSLAFSGRCKVIESKFSNLMLLPAGGELDELWEKQDEYQDKSFLTFAAVIAEVAYGDIIRHPWGMELEKLRLFSVTAIGMLNVFPFIVKCNSLNRDQRIIIDGLSYLVQCLLIRCGSELTANLLTDPERYSELECKIPDKLKVTRYKPIINAIYHDLGIHCSVKCCSKVSHLTPNEKPDYFLRFIESSRQPKRDNRFLILNSIKDECKLGLVPANTYCPLGDTDDFPNNFDSLHEKLEFARMVIKQRAEENT